MSYAVDELSVKNINKGVHSDSKKTTILKELLYRIKKRREELNYSQEYMAAKLNISQKSYSKMELHRNELTISRFFAICEILEIEVRDVVYQLPSA